MSLLKSLKGLYKGWDGELTVELSHWLYLNKKTYHVFNNVTLPLFGGETTQIDHIIVSNLRYLCCRNKKYERMDLRKRKRTKMDSSILQQKISFSKPSKTKL